jgi:hypothetical protein
MEWRVTSEPAPIDEPTRYARASRWKAGDRVRILDGAMKGREGVVREHDGYGHPVVEVGGDPIPYLDGWLEAAPAPITQAETARGVALWQEEDAQNREAMVHIRGHRLTATIQVSPFSDAYTGTFDRPVPADAVGSFLDAVAMTRSRTPIRFGAAEEPPIGEAPYASEAE